MDRRWGGYEAPSRYNNLRIVSSGMNETLIRLSCYINLIMYLPQFIVAVYYNVRYRHANCGMSEMNTWLGVYSGFLAYYVVHTLYVLFKGASMSDERLLRLSRFNRTMYWASLIVVFVGLVYSRDWSKCSGPLYNTCLALMILFFTSYIPFLLVGLLVVCIYIHCRPRIALQAMGSVARAAGATPNQHAEVDLPEHKYDPLGVQQNTACPICITDFEEQETVSELPCGHSYHKDCIQPWIRVQPTCALCRASIFDPQGNLLPGVIRSPTRSPHDNSTPQHIVAPAPGVPQAGPTHGFKPMTLP